MASSYASYLRTLEKQATATTGLKDKENCHHHRNHRRRHRRQHHRDRNLLERRWPLLLRIIIGLSLFFSSFLLSRHFHAFLQNQQPKEDAALFVLTRSSSSSSEKEELQDLWASVERERGNNVAGGAEMANFAEPAPPRFEEKEEEESLGRETSSTPVALTDDHGNDDSEEREKERKAFDVSAICEHHRARMYPKTHRRRRRRNATAYRLAHPGRASSSSSSSSSSSFAAAHGHGGRSQLWFEDDASPADDDRDDGDQRSEGTYDARNVKNLAYVKLQLAGLSDSGLYSAEAAVSALLREYCHAEGGGANSLGAGEAVASSRGRRCESRGGTRFSHRQRTAPLGKELGGGGGDSRVGGAGGGFGGISLEENPRGLELRVRSGPMASPCLARFIQFTAYRKHAAAVGKAPLANPGNLEKLQLSVTRYPARLPRAYHSAPCLDVRPPPPPPPPSALLLSPEAATEAAAVAAAAEAAAAAAGVGVGSGSLGDEADDNDEDEDVALSIVQTAVRSSRRWDRAASFNNKIPPPQSSSSSSLSSSPVADAARTEAVAAAAAAASAVVCIPRDWAERGTVTRLPFSPHSALRWSKLPLPASIVDPVEATRYQMLDFAPGSWVLRHLVVLRDPARVALTRTATGGIFSWDSDLLHDAAELTAAIGR